MDDRCDSPSIRRFHRPGMAKRESLSRFVSGKFKQPKQKLWELSTSRQRRSLPFPKFSPSCVCNLNVKEKIHLYTPVRLIGTEKSSDSTCRCLQIVKCIKNAGISRLSDRMMTSPLPHTLCLLLPFECSCALTTEVTC